MFDISAVSGNAFRRLSFPRDSGCFASNENLNKSSASSDAQKRASPAASDRSSHSGVSFHDVLYRGITFLLIAYFFR